MRKRIFAAALAVIMLLSLMPAVALAAEVGPDEGGANDNTVQIGNDESLVQAITGQQAGQTWEFAENGTYTLGSMMNITADNITLNLNGSTITATGVNYITVTPIDSTTVRVVASEALTSGDTIVVNGVSAADTAYGTDTLTSHTLTVGGTSGDLTLS